MKLFLTLALALATSSAHAQSFALPKKTVDLDARFMTAIGQPGSSRLDSTLRQWDGSQGFPGIVVQSPMGACQSFAMTAWMEYAFYHRTGQVVDLSEKYTAYNLLRYFIDEFYDAEKGEYVERGFGDGTPTLGAGVAMYMIDSTLKTGMIPNAVYPLGDMNAPSGAIQMDLDRRMVVMIAAWVWMGDWVDRFVSTGGGGHAMVIVGNQLQKADDGTEKLFFKLRNSWGTSIGVDGYNIVEDKVLLPNTLEITTLNP